MRNNTVASPEAHITLRISNQTSPPCSIQPRCISTQTNLHLHLRVKSTYTHVIHTLELRRGFSHPFSCLIEHRACEFVDLGP